MSEQDTVNPTLFDLLAREWNTGSEIEAMLFNTNQTAVGYALDNGSVAIADAGDNDPPDQRIHTSAENGRSIIRRRAKTVRPLIMVEVGSAGGLLFGRLGETDFVAGGRNGPLYRVSASGEKTAFDIPLEGPIAATDQSATEERFACAAASQIMIFDNASLDPVLTLEQDEPVTGLSFSPDGQSIAAAHHRGMTVWSLQEDARKTNELIFSGPPNAVSWSPDGLWLATPLSDGGFQLIDLEGNRTRALTGYPSPVGSIIWNRQANAIVTSGAFRVTAWSMDTPPIEDPASGALETGRAGFVPVSAVASHPARNLVAAGYDNGNLVIVQIAGSDEMLLDSNGHGAVTALDWSRDGKNLAVAADNCRAAIISLPELMFK